MANEIISSITSRFNLGSGGISTLILILMVAGVAIAIIIGVFYWIFNRKKWNLDLEIKMPRSDGRIINAEYGKGAYDTKRGVVWVKRKGVRKAAMKPFDIKKYLQGDRVLTIIQTGVNEYVPVLPDSYLELVDDKTGEEASLLKILIDRKELSKDKAWGSVFERDSKNTYTIMNLLREYSVPISIGLIIILWGIQFMILYGKMSC